MIKQLCTIKYLAPIKYVITQHINRSHLVEGHAAEKAALFDQQIDPKLQTNINRCKIPKENLLIGEALGKGKEL